MPHSDEPIFRPVAIALYTTGARLRGEAEGEKKITEWSGGEGEERMEGGNARAGSIRALSTDTLARMSAPVLSSRLLEEPRLSATR